MMENRVLEFYRKYYEEHRKTPSLRVAGGALEINFMTVKYYLVKLEEVGLIVFKNRKVYLARNGKVIDQRKAHNEMANQQKAEAGRAGAEALKKRSLETGISRFNPGLAIDAKKIEANIERIVQRAFENGTAYHPRPKLVVLIGEKVG